MNDAEMGGAVRNLVVAWLAWHEELGRRELSAELEDRVAGYRVVNGGQVGSDGAWEVTDAETGELLAAGVGLGSFDASWQDSWTHVDAISNQAYVASDQPDGDFGLPAGMAKTLIDWVVDRPEEARRAIEA